MSEFGRDNPYSEILKEIEAGLWEHDCRVDDGIATPYKYDDETFRACLKIFMSGTMWKIWESMEGKTIQEKADAAEACGARIRELILAMTGIDTHQLYKKGSDT